MRPLPADAPAEARAVITGIGVVSPIGIGKTAFWSALKRGEAGIRPVSLFDTSRLPCHFAGEATDFRPEDFFERRGLKYLDRSTQLAAAATALALDDAGLGPRIAGQPTDIGLVLGTAFGSVESISGFDRQILREGPRAVNPMGFPRTVINSPAGHVAIRFGLTGLNATISAGGASSHQAIGYAADFIQMGRADILLAGGVEELALPSYSGFCAAKLLSGACGRGPEIAAPFDANRTGFSVGEGAAIVVIESARHAAARGAAVCASVLGFASLHASPAADLAGARAMHWALREAGLEPAAIDCISAGANGSRHGDEIEARSIAKVFGERALQLPIHSIKSLVGEAPGPGGAFQVAAAAMTLADGTIPPTLNFRAAERAWRIDGVSAQPRSLPVSTLAVNSPIGEPMVASLVIGRGGDPAVGGSGLP